jgi:hypothetical protein
VILQDFLRNGGSPADLLETYAIKNRPSGSLVLFKYDQINSPMAEPIVQEARGVILDSANNWNVVARAFDKFFNHGDQMAAQIDWSTARVQEKVDGSLCMLYHYDSEWHVATTGTPDASGDVNGSGITFADLFWRTFQKMGLPLPEAETNKAFLFELTSPLNRIIVRQTDERLTLLGIRRRDGKWYDPELWSDRYPVVKSYPLTSFDSVLASFEHIDPLSSEGYVVVDGDFRRVKVKHPGYVALHHMKGEGAVTPRRVLQVLLAGESTEVLTAFPEWAPHFTEAQAALDVLSAQIADDFSRLRHIPIQKDFALEAVKTRCSAALFQLRQGRIAAPIDHLRAMQIDKLADMLGLRADPKAEAA